MRFAEMNQRIKTKPLRLRHGWSEAFVYCSYHTGLWLYRRNLNIGLWLYYLESIIELWLYVFKSKISANFTTKGQLNFLFALLQYV